MQKAIRRLGSLRVGDVLMMGPLPSLPAIDQTLGVA